MGKHLGKWSLGWPRRRWENNTKLYLTGINCECGKWKKVAQDCVQWWALVFSYQKFGWLVGQSVDIYRYKLQIFLLLSTYTSPRFTFIVFILYLLIVIFIQQISTTVSYHICKLFQNLKWLVEFMWVFGVVDLVCLPLKFKMVHTVQFNIGPYFEPIKSQEIHTKWWYCY